MGFKPPVEEVILDEDGFEQVGNNRLGEIDEDFAVDDGSSNEEISQAIENFINESMNKVFVGRVERSDSGYWNINVDTLKPLGK